VGKDDAKRGKTRILVVDDEPPIRNLAARALEMNGYEVEQASGGEEALEKLAATSFDLLLLDVNMPGVSGREVLTRLQDYPLDHRPPVLLTSGKVTTFGRHLSGIKVLDVVRKPFQIRYLIDKVEKALLGEIPKP
jgi:DNA-binding response OmpR family regulator